MNKVSVYFIYVILLKGEILSLERGIFDLWFSPCKCRCGISNREARLAGGEYLRGHEFPWAAQLQVSQPERSLPATLINDRYLLTAATNLIGVTPLDVKVTLGQFDRCYADVSSSNISVDKIIIHQDFSQANRAHDIALVKVSTPIKIEKKVSPICLSTPNTRYLGQVATVSSWADLGKTEDVTYSCRPRKLGLPVLGRAECMKAAIEPEYLSMDKGCLGVIGLGSPVCNADAGGGVMFRDHQGIYELIGILIDKNECSTKPHVAIYTTINDQINWISRNTRDACYCFKT